MRQKNETDIEVKKLKITFIAENKATMYQDQNTKQPSSS